MKQFYLKVLGILVLLLPNYLAFSQNQMQRATNPLNMVMSGTGTGRMIVGDFDKDGDIDILYQNGNTLGVGIGYVKNNGGGLYQDYPDATVAGTPFFGFSFAGENITVGSLFVFDIDNDGDVDVLDRDGTMGMWRNENGTSFTHQATPFTVPAWTLGFPRMIVGDFDIDGDQDILFQIGNTIGTNFQYLQNNGSGAFTLFNASDPGTPFTSFNFANQQMFSLIVLDYDVDGDVDIIDRDGVLGVWKNNAGSFTYDVGPFTSLNMTTGFGRLIFGDFDADGDPDVLYQDGNVIGAGFGYARNDGSGAYTNYNVATTAPGPFNGFDFTGEQMASLFVFDYDKDGDVDIVDRDNATYVPTGEVGQLGIWRQVGTPPTRISTSPADNATNVLPTANIVLTFNEAVTKGTGNIYLYNLTNSTQTSLAVGDAAVTSADNLSWTINFPGDFAVANNYAVRLDAGIFKDVDNMATAAITNNTTFNFFVPLIPPTITNLNGDAVVYTEAGTAAKLDLGGNATASDNLPDFNGAVLTVSFTANAVAAQDILGIENQGVAAGQIGISGANVTYGGVTFATFTGGTSPANLVVTMNSSASYTAVTALLRALTYSNNSNNANANTRNISISITDAETAVATVNVTATITRVNNAPTLTVPTNFGVSEDIASPLTGIGFVDVDGGISNLAQANITVTIGTLSGTSGGGVTVTGSGTSSITLQGTRASIQSFVTGLNLFYLNTPTQTTNATLSVTYNDAGDVGTGGPLTASAGPVPILFVVIVNDIPTITAPPSISVGEDVASPLAGYSFGDIDAGTATVDVTLSVPAGNGILAAVAGSGVAVTTVSANELMLSGSIADINAFIAANNVNFTTALNNTANVTLTVKINDRGNTGNDPGTSGTGTSEEASTTVTLIVTAVNNAPTITAPPAYAVTEDIPTTIGGISFADVDGGTSNATQATFSVSLGTLNATSGGGVTVAGTGTGTLTLTGSRININAFITANNIQYNLGVTQTTDASLNISFNDAGDVGSGGPLSANAGPIPLNVTYINDRPVITAPASITVQEDVLSNLAGYSFTDIDAAASLVDVTLSVPSGSGTLTAATTGGVTVTIVSPNELMLTGTVTAINSYISANNAGFTTALNNASNVILTIKINDRGNTGTDPGTSGTATSEEATATTTLMVTAINDAPVINTQLDQSTLMDITKVFNAANSNLISVSDVDAGSAQISMRVEASAGLLSLSGTTGLTFTTGDGTADAIIQFTGTLANVNAALNGLSLAPPIGVLGDIIITLKADDLGNSPGAALSDTKVLTLHVLPSTPTVLSVSSSTPDGAYKVGDVVLLTVTFNQPVNVTGTPTLTLETGVTDRQANYTSGSGTSILTFSYTVQSGDQSADLDYASINALAIGGGSIRNGSLLDAALGLPATGSANSIAGSKNLVIDGIAPFITSVNVPVNKTYLAGQPLNFSLNFSEVITVNTAGGTPGITVQLESGPVQATYVSGSGSNVLLYRYVVATGNLDNNGIALGIHALNGATFRDATGNDALLTLNGVPPTTGILVDAADPVVTSVTVPANKIWKAGEVLNFTVNFSEPVIKTGATDPFIVLTIGSSQVQATYKSGTGTNAYLFSYTIVTGDLDRNGIAVGPSPSISLNGVTLKDAAGNDANLLLNNIGNLLNVWVDAVTPIVTAAQVFSVAENSAAATAVGTVLGTDPGSTGTLQQWAITSNVNSDGDANPAFAINAATGAITVNDAGDLNFEATSSLTISVSVSDGVNTSAVQTVVINLTNMPEPPLDIALSNNTILENNASGAQVGLLSATSTETGTTYTYTLVAGGADNTSFSIVGNSLRAAIVFDAETKTAYNIRIRATTQAGEFLEKPFVVTVTNVNEAPTLNAITDRPYCATTAEVVIPLTGITPGPETTQTTMVSVSSNNAGLFTQLTADNTAVRLRFAAGANGNVTITVTVKDNGGTANNGTDQVVRSFNIAVTSIAAPVITSNKGTKVSKGDFAALTATGGVSYVWDNSPGIISGQNSNVLNIRPQQNVTYRVTASNAAGCSASAQLAIEVIEDYKVNSANIMTPNGDGINDKFIIKNIDSYPNNELKIFDRSGRLIYTKRGYQNEWDGRINGKALEEGTYYFMLDFGPGLPKVKGFITIIRDIK